MRIAYLHYLYGDDTALHHVRQFAAAATSLGHQVDVHAMNLAPQLALARPQPNPMAARLRRMARERFGRYLHEPKELAWNVCYVRHELRRLAAGSQPDVLLVRDEALTASTVVVAARLGLPLVYEINAPASELALYFDEYLHLPLVPDWLEGLRLRRADAVTTVSTALREYLIEHHRLRGLAADKLTVVPNGADLTAFSPLTEPSPLARHLLRLPAGGRRGSWAHRADVLSSLDDTRVELPPGRPADPSVGDHGPVVGFVGSFQKFHGVELLVDMMLKVAAARQEVRFLLIGDGPGAAQVRSRLGPLGDRVVLTGRVPHAEVPGLVAAFDIGVLAETSFYACPLKVIEWMAAGKAVVAPRYGPLTEVMADGVEGLLFPPRDLGALVERVLRLVDRPGLRWQLGGAAAARAAASMSWTDNARQVVGVLEQAQRCATAAGRVQANLSSS